MLIGLLLFPANAFACSPASVNIEYILDKPTFSQQSFRDGLWGETRANAIMNVGGRIITNYSDGKYCGSVDVNIEFGYQDISVELSDKLVPGSCAYNKTYEHEMRHVRVIDSAFEKFQQDSFQELKAFPKMYSSREEAERHINSVLLSMKNRIFAKINAYTQMQNMQIDNPINRKADFNACSDWP